MTQPKKTKYDERKAKIKKILMINNGLGLDGLNDATDQILSLFSEDEPENEFKYPDSSKEANLEASQVVIEPKKSWETEYDEKYKDPMEKRHGKGFALYCSFCSGEWREEIKQFIRQLLSDQKSEILSCVPEEASFEKTEVFYPKMTSTEGLVEGWTSCREQFLSNLKEKNI